MPTVAQKFDADHATLIESLKPKAAAEATSRRSTSDPSGPRAKPTAKARAAAAAAAKKKPLAKASARRST